mgnify:CR=1 FL=1
MNTNQQIIHAALRARLESERKQLQELGKHIERERPEQERIAKEYAESLAAKIKEILGFDVDVVYPEPLVDPPTMIYNHWVIYQANYELDDYFRLSYCDGQLYVYRPEWNEGIPINNLEDLGIILMRDARYQDEMEKMMKEIQ